MSSKLDEMKGVIRDIGDSDVSVSLFQDDEEFCLDIPRRVFESGGVRVREHEGFLFWVERDVNGCEQPFVVSLPRHPVSRQDRQQIDAEIAELLDGELE